MQRGLNNLTRFLLVTCVCGWSAAAFAHPHEFVEMKVKVVFNDKGEVTGMTYHWLFDEIFSAYAVEPADKDGDGKPEPETLDDVLKEILGNIAPINYFTKFSQSSLTPKFAAAKPRMSRMKKRQFEVQFDVPFAKPLALAGKEFTYAIYDEEFYIAMNYTVEPGAVELVNAPKACGFEIVLPDPTEETRNFASSLSKTQSSGTDLGINFAEWVQIKCK